MPIKRPGLDTLIKRAEEEVTAQMPQTARRPRYSLLSILARMVAGFVHGLYGGLSSLAAQAVPTTATGKYLEAWCGVWKIYKLDATKAQGSVLFTGNNGAVIPANTLLKSQSGIEYKTLSDITLVGSQTATRVVSLSTGLNTNLAVNGKLNLQSPIAGVDSSVVSQGIAGGSDAEDDERLRSRLIARISAPSSGGNIEDYKRWALESHPSITKAFVSPLEMGAGSVTIRVMAGSDIPSEQVIAAVQAYIENKKPSTAKVYVVAPIKRAINITIHGITPNTLAVKQAITAQLQAFFSDSAAPGKIVLLSHIRNAISTAQGEIDHRLDLPTGNISVDKSEIAVLGTITWT